MATGNLTEGETQSETLDELFPPLTAAARSQHLIYLSAVNIFLSLTAFLGNFLILVALHKESSLHPPSKLLYRCLATTDLCVGLVCQPLAATKWMLTAIHKFAWSASFYQYLDAASFITIYILGPVSLLTLSAISVDRLLALSLGLRYRQVVTLKRTYLVVVTFWVVSIVAATLYLADKRITFWYGYVVVAFCIAISIASYTKVFLAFRHHHTQVEDHFQQQLSQPNALNITRYRKAVNSALCVQLALVVCYLPYSLATVLVGTDRRSPHYVAWVITVTLVYFNSSLNPFLYCWKISEVRQAVKETIKQALCCSWS